MPGWHEATKHLQEEGKVQMVGIIEEQHPDRCALFMQWKQMDWPILVDSLNLLEVSAVPITLAIDEHGVIQGKKLSLERARDIEETFLNRESEAAAVRPAGPTAPSLEALKAATRNGDAAGWRRYADALVMWGGPGRLDEAIAAYQEVLSLEPEDGPTQFRIGVAYRKRYDLGQRQEGDFRHAVQHWKKALDLDPNQYIWRRRIQQYGPRLDKPYPFYDWVQLARRDVAARGEKPVALEVEPGGAEFAAPVKSFLAAAEGVEPDANGRIHRDEGGFVRVETTVVPPALGPGEAARVHVVFRPNRSTKAHWNNEVDQLQYWVNPPQGWQVDQRLLTAPNPPQPVSQETRKVEFEVRCPDDAQSGSWSLSSYVLYYVCEDVNGTCLYRRQDIVVPLAVGRGPS